MTFKKEKGVIMEEEEKEQYPGPHIYPNMIIELVEEMLIDAPNKNKHIFAEVSFGTRGIDKKPLFYPKDRVIENTIKWFYLFKETIELYQNLNKEDEVDLETKGSSKRILTKAEKEYILSVARGSKLPLIAAAKQVPTTENIEFLRQGYLYIREISKHLENLDKGDLIQELKDKGLVPIIPDKDTEEDIKTLSDDTILSYIEKVNLDKEVEKDYYVKDPEGKDTSKRLDKQITMEKIDEKIVSITEKIGVVSEIKEDIQEKVSAKKIESVIKKKEDDPFPEEKDPFEDAK